MLRWVEDAVSVVDKTRRGEDSPNLLLSTAPRTSSTSDKKLTLLTLHVNTPNLSSQTATKTREQTRASTHRNSPQNRVIPLFTLQHGPLLRRGRCVVPRSPLCAILTDLRAPQHHHCLLHSRLPRSRRFRHQRPLCTEQVDRPDPQIPRTDSPRSTVSSPTLTQDFKRPLVQSACRTSQIHIR